MSTGPIHYLSDFLPHEDANRIFSAQVWSRPDGPDVLALAEECDSHYRIELSRDQVEQMITWLQCIALSMDR